jgi:hypothetical protein
MNKFIFKIILILPFVLSCSGDKNITGNDFPFRKISNMVFSTTVYPSNYENLICEKKFGSRDKLLLGKIGDYTLKILIKFQISGEFKTINSATLVLKPYDVESTTTEGFEGIIYEIKSDWDENTNQGITYNTSKVTTFSLSQTSVDSITIPPILIQKWYSDTTSNKGIMIDSKNANFIKRYFSKENVFEIPYLTIKGDTEGGELTLTFYPEMDTYLVESEAKSYSNELIVDNLSIYRAIIKFDTIGISKNSTINLALLELSLKNENSIIIGNDKDKIYAFRIDSSSWKPEELRFDDDNLFSNQHYSTFTDSGIVQINVTGIAQQWLSNLKENYGLLLISYNEGEYAGKYVFNWNQKESPKLIIEYTVPRTENQF